MIELGPAVMIRAAAWPIEALDLFGDPDLSSCALEGGADYLERYAAAVDRERELLWRSTALDARFMKALAVSNLSLAERVGELALRRAVRNKRVRHAETSLYRYLARAVSRTEPCDLWAGVQLATFGAAPACSPALAGRAFSPDLKPFQAMLRALSRRCEHRVRGRYRANATLGRCEDGSWRFLARRPDGRTAARVLSFDPELDALLATLRGMHPQPLHRIARRTGVELETLEQLIDAGALVGGLDLPVEFETPWQALRLAARALRGRERSVFRGAVSRLRRLAVTLEQRFDVLAPDEVTAHLLEAEHAVEELAVELGVVLAQPPRAVLRCDLRLPHRIVLGPEQRVWIEAALAEYEEVQRALGPGIKVRAALADELQERIGAGLALAGLEAPTARREAPRTWRDFGADVEARVAHWEALAAERCEGMTCTAVSVDAPPVRPLVPPFGVLMLNHGAVRGIFDEPALVYSRFAPLFARRGRADPYRAWLTAELARFSRESGRAVVELLSHYERNPNVLARPRLTGSKVELWSATPGAGSLEDARVVIDPVRALPQVDLDGGDRSALIFSFASAAVGDPATDLLLRTSFRDAPMPSFVASTMPLSPELASPRFSPRISLPSGAVLRQRRTVLSGDALRALLDASPPERFRKFQELARRYGWPPLIAVRRDAQPLVSLRTASPLALEAVLEGAREVEALIVEEPSGIPWLTDRDGRRYVTEVAVPFSRRVHSWSCGS